MEKVEEVKKKKNQSYQKYRKYIGKAIAGVVIGAIGLAIPASLFVTLPDLWWGVGMFGKLALSAYGIIKTLVNGNKASKARAEFEAKNSDFDNLATEIEKDLTVEKQKNEEYEKTVSKTKGDYEKLKSEVLTMKTRKTKTPAKVTTKVNEEEIVRTKTR